MEAPSASLARDLAEKGIDVGLSASILDDYNAGLYDSLEPVVAHRVPAIDGVGVVAPASEHGICLPLDKALAIASGLGVELPRGVQVGGALARFDHVALADFGLSLYPRAAWGILNGGSATSYADRKKNLAYGPEVFALLEEGFAALEPLCRNRPKGLAPAYLNPDGSPGASFLILKLRARLLAAAEYRRRHGDPGRPLLPLFQMSSTGNDAELASAYEEMAGNPLIRGPAAALGGIEASGAVEFQTGVQPMIAAFSHSAEGRPKRIFDRAWGRADSALALPGGHGQCFRILAGSLKALHRTGVRWAWLGNVDNLGYLPDPSALALLALSGQPAAFEFSFRTPLDVKGGILVETASGSRTIADIGPAITFEQVRALEEGGASVLFNCATGLFDLDWLVPRIEDLGRRLPVRFTDQDKEAGRYAQAEQVTWEVASLLPGFLALAVDKYERFISAKLLAETLLTSGLGAGDARVPAELSAASLKLHEGLARKLAGPYGLALRDGRWTTLS